MTDGRGPMRVDWALLLATLVAYGCASGRVAEDAAISRAPGAEPEKIAAPGLGRHVDPPVIRVERLGARWGLELERIASPERRAEVERDLAAVEVERALRKEPPPGRCVLLFPSTDVVLVVALPSPLCSAPNQPIACFVWDYTGERTPCRLELAIAGSGTAAADDAPRVEVVPASPARRTGACAHRVYAAAPPRGLVRLVVALRRADHAVATLDVPLEAVAPVAPPRG